MAVSAVTQPTDDESDQGQRDRDASVVAISRAQASIASQSRKSPVGSIFLAAGIIRTTRSDMDLGGSLGSMGLLPYRWPLAATM